FSMNSEPEKSGVVMLLEKTNVVKKTNTILEVPVGEILWSTYRFLDDAIGRKGPLGYKTHRKLDPKGTGNIPQCLCRPPVR
ncbi:hypothetical protein DBR06_SOUSAS310009, partial [Sousa chinensis]